MKATHLVTVLGREIPVKSSAPEEKVKAVEAFVNERINEINSRLVAADPQLVVTLALLNLAESCLEKQSLKTDAEMEARIVSLLNKLNQTLETPGLFRET